jgi:hypothetical protein
LSEEAGEQDDYKHYMFRNLEGSLWLREAFMQVQWLGPQIYTSVLALMSLVVSGLGFGMVLMKLRGEQGEKLIYNEWIAQLPTYFWVYHSCLLLLNVILLLQNFTFLAAGM